MMTHCNDEMRDEPNPAEEGAAVDAAESIWDPWLVRMYLDALRTARRDDPDWLHWLH